VEDAGCFELTVAEDVCEAGHIIEPLVLVLLLLGSADQSEKHQHYQVE